MTSGKVRSLESDNAIPQYKFPLKDLYKSAPLYLGFIATGVGVALPGALLPILLTRWHLQDAQGGMLFLMVWMGASLGALFVSDSLDRSLLIGSGTVAVASISLSLCTGQFANVATFFYGLGLGITMTTISLFRQQRSRDSGNELVRLNFLWAIGACIGPSLTIHTLRTDQLGPLLYGVALVFGLLAAWSIAQPHLQKEYGILLNRRPWSIFRTVPWALIVLVMLATGVEAAAGGWLATYAKRGGDPLSQIIAAPTALWAGLLLSRLFWSFNAHSTNSNWVIRGSVLIMASASTLLLVSRHGWPFLIASGCLGFGIGPTYPLLLARVLRLQAGGNIFFLAGIGSACLPWLTGIVSTQRGSLHAGFAVPAVATLLMVLMSFACLHQEQAAAPVRE